jgi:AAA15 family ATPase/GTPase
MIRELTIKNDKSILDHTIELGRINVFIGENGATVRRRRAAPRSGT